MMRWSRSTRGCVTAASLLLGCARPTAPVATSRPRPNVAPEAVAAAPSSTGDAAYAAPPSSTGHAAYAAAPSSTGHAAYTAPRARHIRDLVVGGGQACVVFDDESIACWKLNMSDRRLIAGRDVTSDFDAPMVAFKVEGLGAGRVLQVAVYGNRGCAVIDPGEVRCWTYDLHEAGPADRPRPTPSPATTIGVPPASSVAVSASIGYAVLRDGSAWSWAWVDPKTKGDPEHVVLGNPILQMARNPRRDLTRPGPLEGLHDVVSLSADYRHACALLSDQTVECWGDGDYGMLGRESWKPTSVPVPVPGVQRAKKIAVYDDSSCALVEGGQLWCWGLITASPPPDGVRAGTYTTPKAGTEMPSRSYHVSWSPVPLRIAGLGTVVDFTDSYLSCVMDTGGGVSCWGISGWGRKDVRLTRAPFRFAAKLMSGVPACVVGRDDQVACVDWDNARMRFQEPDIVRLPE